MQHSSMGCHLRKKILEHDRAVPRYTSYPTAPHFAPQADSSLYADWLSRIGEGEEVSLYIHVPFCSQMCWYCGCNTKVTRKYDPIESYIRNVLIEIGLVGESLATRGLLRHVHFGGGSPGLLGPADFSAVVGALSRFFTIDKEAEIAIEIDPRGVTEGRVAGYAKNGVNRISLGVQDFDDKVLKAVNREQPYALSYDAVRMFRDYGIDKINIDLLYGLPHQSVTTMESSIDKALTLRPDRISLFGYAHVPWMKKHMRLIDEGALPDKSLRFDMFARGAEMLEAAGYVPIGIDHFAKPDDELAIAARNGTMRRNFQGYTTDQSQTMIGIGASSIGKFAQGYAQNHTDMPLYEAALAAGRLPVSKMCPIDREDLIYAHVIERVMCDFGIDLAQVCERFNVSSDYFSESFAALRPLADAGFIEPSDSDMNVRINPAARPVARLVAACFDQYLRRKPEAARHSRAV